MRKLPPAFVSASPKLPRTRVPRPLRAQEVEVTHSGQVSQPTSQPGNQPSRQPALFSNPYWHTEIVLPTMSLALDVVCCSFVAICRCHRHYHRHYQRHCHSMFPLTDCNLIMLPCSRTRVSSCQVARSRAEKPPGTPNYSAKIVRQAIAVIHCFRLVKSLGILGIRSGSVLFCLCGFRLQSLDAATCECMY